MSQPSQKVSRRTLFAGAGTAGALAAAASLIPAKPTPEAEAVAAPTPPERGGGYQLSAHVRRYYQTTRV